MAKLDISVKVTRNTLPCGLGAQGERVLAAAMAIPHHRRADIERAFDTITHSPECTRLLYALQDFWNAL